MERFAAITSVQDQEASDVNDENLIQPFFNEKVLMLALEHLRFDNMQNLEGDYQLHANSFSQLGVLEVSNCDNLNLQIIITPTASPTMLNLREVKLCNLPKQQELISFHQNSIEFPHLEKITIENCSKMKRLAAIATANASALDQEAGDVHDENLIQPFFNKRVVLPVLEYLTIIGQQDMEKLWHNELPTESFCKLKNLKVKKCDKLTEVIPLNLPSRLEKLHKSSVKESPEVRRIAVGEGSVHSLNSCLEAVELVDLPKLTELWWNKKDQNGIVFDYPNLYVLTVTRCHGLRNIFWPSVIKHFRHLRKLSIGSCSSMEEVVAKEEQGEYYSGDKLVFPKVEYLTLTDLPNLSCYRSAHYTLEWPSLEKLTVDQCFNMQTFSSGLLIAPHVTEIEVGENGEELWKGDINATIHHMFKVQRLARGGVVEEETIYAQNTKSEISENFEDEA